MAGSRGRLGGMGWRWVLVSVFLLAATLGSSAQARDLGEICRV